jgi:hypothetical protein
MAQWADVEWKALYASADEAILTTASATIENATYNPAGGLSRFPGLRPFVSIPGQRVYLKPWNGDLYAATDQGRLWRIGRQGTTLDVTGVPISGGQRVIMEATDDRLVLAAGGPILALQGRRTEVLSRDAPETTHVAFVDGYLIAIERWSQRFLHCAPGEYDKWDPLDVFSANAKADALNAVAVTPYRELLLAGEESIEQFERLPNGSQPFSRRWSAGEGVAYPYTLTSDKTGTYGVNPRHEFVRFAGQVSQEQGEPVGLVLSKIDDWTDAWAQSVTMFGDPYVVLQAPDATSQAYQTKGVTLLMNQRDRRWAFLYGFDRERGVPARYPAWSFASIWGRTFAGVPGGIAEVSDGTYDLLGQPMPFVIRSGHIDKFGPSRVDNLRIRIKRGVGEASGRAPQIGIRVNRDNRGFGPFQWRGLGTEGRREMTIEFGGQGASDTWQWEMRVTDPVDVQFVGMQILVERLGW